MILVGDVAIADGDLFLYRGFPEAFSTVPICFNLEGAIAKGGERPARGLYNSEAWRRSFGGMQAHFAFLANNHIHDVDDGVSRTRRRLAESGITGFGAGLTVAEAASEVICESGDQRYCLLGAGWPVIGCKPAGPERAGVNRLDGARLVADVARLSSCRPKVRIVLVLHWNYEFERYPQPAHRKLAMDLIDAGAYAIVGHHPHIVGAVERYKGHTIAYSLGNWAFSFGRYFGGKLKFPEASFGQIALELGDEGDTVHHAMFEPPSTIVYRGAERVDSTDFSLAPTFEGMEDGDYAEWFRTSRIKRKMLPVYRSYENNFENRCKDAWVAFRQVGIDTATRFGIKSLRRRT